MYLSLPFPSSAGRCIVVTVLTQHAGSTPTVCAVQVKVTDTFEAVFHALGKSEEERQWQFAEVYDRQVVRLIPMDREIARVRDGTPLFLFETTPPQNTRKGDKLFRGKRMIYTSPRTDELLPCVLLDDPEGEQVEILLTFNGK